MKIVNEEHRTNKILTAIAIASLFIGSSRIMAIETYSEKFIRSDRTDAGTNSPRYCCRPEWRAYHRSKYLGKRYYQLSYYRLIR